MMRRWLLVVTLGLAGFVAGCEDGESPAADAQVADAGPPDATEHLPSDCDNVFYWCEDAKVYMGRPRWPNCAIQGGMCAQDDPGWFSVQLVGMCQTTCGAPVAGSCGLDCETNQGTSGCYAEDATMLLCAAAP